MKNYTIYLKAVEDESTIKSRKKPTKVAVEEGMGKAKTIFGQAIKENIQAKEIVLSKEQPYNDAVALGIKEIAFDKVMDKFRALDVVYVIEAEYSGPVPASEKK
jgi:hypothetical protein